MSTPSSMNQTESNEYLNNNNNNKIFVPVQGKVYTPVQPVPVVAGAVNPMAMPVNAQQPPMIVGVPYQGQAPPPEVIQSQQTNNNPQVIVIKEQRPSNRSGRCCYCRGPRQSPCGCCSPNEEYCCIIIVFAYIIMSLHYILTCLFIWRLCRRGFRYGWC